jgi:antitoxin component of MazEF toxin-antitoxin module
MIKTLQKVGNSKALILDKALLEQLGIRDDDLVQLVVSGSNLIVSPVIPCIPDEEFDKVLKRIMTKHDKALRNLGK